MELLTALTLLDAQVPAIRIHTFNFGAVLYSTYNYEPNRKLSGCYTQRLFCTALSQYPFDEMLRFGSLACRQADRSFLAR